MSTARSRMTMRASVERNTASGTDAHGHPVTPSFTSTGDPVPCFVWSTAKNERRDGDKQAVVEDWRMLIPKTADVVNGDEIASVEDRQGNEVLPGRMRVETVQPKHTHREAVLQRVA